MIPCANKSYEIAVALIKVHRQQMTFVFWCIAAGNPELENRKRKGRCGICGEGFALPQNFF